MVNVVRIRKDSNDSPRTDVAEIDTRAPFQSVKAAVSLFGDTISSPSTKPASFKKSKSQGVLDKEAEFHFTQKELGKFKSKVKNAESEANKALPELEKAMKTLMDIKDKIKAINASRDSIIEDTEALRIKAKELEQENSSKRDGNGDELETSRNKYTVVSVELDSAKQELSRLHGDFGSAMEAKLSALHMAEEAQLATMAQSKKVSELKESLDQIKLSTIEEQAKVSAEKEEEEGEERACRIAKEELERKLHELQEKETEGLNGAEALDLKLEEMNKEIEDLKEKIIQAKEALSESERTAYSEVSSAREAFKKVEQERQYFQETIESIKLELAGVGNEIGAIKEKEDQEKSFESRLKVELQERKLDLEAMLASEVKEAEDSSEMRTKLEKLLMLAKQAKEEAWEMRNAQNALKIVSERKDFDESAVDLDDRDQKKELMKEEYDDLKEKASGSEKMAEMKAASAMAELEELKASKSEAMKKLNENLKMIEEMDKATEEAFKQAEMAEAAKSKAVSELRRKRQEHCS